VFEENLLSGVDSIFFWCYNESRNDSQSESRDDLIMMEGGNDEWKLGVGES
jgi:hypothetical protein